MASKRLSKLGVQFHFICRHTALTSIQSSNYLPNSKPCCGRSLHIPSRTPLSPSTACARPSPLVSATSLGLSVQHSSPTQDMVNLTGKRSSDYLIDELISRCKIDNRCPKLVHHRLSHEESNQGLSATGMQFEH